MMFLFDHLKEGSFRTAYADTDSMCLGLTKTRPLRPNMTREEEYRAIFDPIVKDEMRESWEETWKNWFVTTTEVEDERFPGKLKRRFFELKSYKNLIFRRIWISTWALHCPLPKMLLLIGYG